MDLWNVVLVVSAISVLFVFTQAVVIAYLVKWNRELIEEIEELKPPF